ncbi:hypothetical protein M3Y96_00299800 [Aphelenchoides besseyi]|nr:hypothetical protein M3Y96_00299800 [Aphelenchoides besseyi]
MKSWMSLFWVVLASSFEYAGAFGNNECIKNNGFGHYFEFSSCQAANINIKWKSDEMLFLGCKAANKEGGDNFKIFFNGKSIDFHTRIVQNKWVFEVGETPIICDNKNDYCGIVIQSDGTVGPFVYSSTPIDFHVSVRPKDGEWAHAEIRVEVESILSKNKITVAVAGGNTGVLEDVETTTTGSTTMESSTLALSTLKENANEFVNLTGDAFQSASCVVVSVHLILGCIAVFFFECL